MESGKKQVVWGKMDIPEGMLQPYIVNTDLQAMKAACELCKTESCCPEHCCDWDSCQCNHCGSRRKNLDAINRPASAYRRTFDTKTWQNVYEPTEDPEVFIPAENEIVELNKNKKKNFALMNKKDKEQLETELAKKDFIETLPSEVIVYNEGYGPTVSNFEVEFKDDEEIQFSGGVRGIRGLRAQRAIIEKEIAVNREVAEAGKNKFERFEQNREEESKV